MSTAAHLISQYNNMDGKPASVAMLRTYHADVTRYLDSAGTGPHVPALAGIQKKIAGAIKRMSEADLNNFIAKIKVDEPVQVPNMTKKKPTQKDKNSKAGVGLKDLMNLSGASDICLSGLENIQDDSGLGGEALSGLNDPTYQVITDKILSLIKDEGLIWRKPWNAKVNGSSDMAHNHVTKHTYSGANFYLNYLLLKDYSNPKYFTFNQVSKLGGSVIKNQKGWPVVYFKWLYKHIASNKLVDEKEALTNEKLKSGYDKFPVLFYYKVFNYEQCEGLKIQIVPSKKKTEKEKIESAEKIIDGMPKRPKIQKGNEAWYSQAKDLVQLVPLDQFKVDQEYYSVAFHELIHSTGHPDRVKRDLTGRFGTKNYAFEELIAELGASFLCGESGILYYTLKNSAAYIKNWSTKLKEEMARDPKFFLQAAGQAHKAAEFMQARGAYHDLKKIKKEKIEEKPVNKLALSGQKLFKKTTPKKVKKVSAKEICDHFKKKMFEPKKSKRVEEKAVPENKSPLKVAKPIHPEEGKAESTNQQISKSSGAVDASKLAGVKFRSLALGPFAKDFHKLNSDSNVMIWGLPGSGKTVMLLKLAQHFAESGEKVLYIAEEEFGKSTLAEKITTFKIGNKNLKFAPELINLSPFDVIFFDSINSLQLAPKDVKSLDKKYPNKLFILIVQTTKAGDFRGGQDWEHLVDIAGEVKNRKLILRKNRLDPNNGEKAAKLHTTDAIEEAKKKMQIRKAVKAELEPKKEEETLNQKAA